MSVTANPTKTIFLSSQNYMKRDVPFCGSAVLTLDPLGGATTLNVVHNLGYIPFYSVMAEIDEPDVIWTGGKVSEFTDQEVLSGGSQPTYPTLNSWSTTTTLTIELLNDTSPLAVGNRTVSYLLYKDYGNVS